MWVQTGDIFFTCRDRRDKRRLFLRPNFKILPSPRFTALKRFSLGRAENGPESGSRDNLCFREGNPTSPRESLSGPG